MSTPHPEPATDRARLVGAAYATADPLRARIALYEHQREPFDFVGWVLDNVEAEHSVTSASRVVDIGCGPGRYLADLRARHPGITTVGLDLSPGMLHEAAAVGAPVGVADAMQLPIRSGACDVAIAAHMLYHVPDIALAATELARVIGPAGIVAVVTNGRGHLREIDRVASDAVVAVEGSPWTAPSRSAARFHLEDAPALVAPALVTIAVEHSQREIVVPDPAPIVAYVASTESLYEHAVPHGTLWSDVLAQVEASVAAVIEREGAFTVHSDGGMMLCRAA